MSEDADRCPHCGVLGHWPIYEAEQLALMRCPWSGLPLMADDGLGYCGVCDCFGYPMNTAPPLPSVAGGPTHQRRTER